MTRDNNQLGTFNLEGIPPAPRGVPQIEVSFDLDANGILNVRAEDKSSGKSKNITIKNDRGRLSQADIDKMLAEAERYKEEDEKQRKKVAARNQLESTAYQYKQAVEEHGSKLETDDCKKVKDKCDEVISWIDNNRLADEEEYQHQISELNKTCSPVMTKLHGQGNSSNANSGQQPSSSGYSGPTVEEVD
jgi:L1 cell adhesion molecule like protein